jgi:hypothetical protein
MRSRSPGGRILARLEGLLPDGSPSALYIGDLLKEGPTTDPEEQKFVADGQSAILSFLGAVLLFPAIGAGALVNALWGLGASRPVAGVLFVPAVFVMMVAMLVQVAKFRSRFDGVQPLFGHISWAICVAVTAAVAIVFVFG